MLGTLLVPKGLSGQYDQCKKEQVSTDERKNYEKPKLVWPFKALPRTKSVMVLAEWIIVT